MIWLGIYVNKEQYNGVAKIEVAPLNLMLPNVSTDEKMDVGI